MLARTLLQTRHSRPYLFPACFESTRTSSFSSLRTKSSTNSSTDTRRTFVSNTFTKMDTDKNFENGVTASDRGDLKEYSVVYTDRAVNLMSSPFQGVMRDISQSLKSVYNASACAIIPGSGTYAMEAVARQFGTNETCLVIRNGFFSFRWSDIFEACDIPKEEIVLKAKAVDDTATPQFAPLAIEEVVQAIKEKKPKVVFAPHVETATGILIPDEYVVAVANAVHEVGGLFVLDSIASGTLWVDMEKLGVDVLITAPQKGWSGPACCGIVMLGPKALEVLPQTKPTSFCCNLTKWLAVMQKYEEGSFMYYTTLPTDALTMFRNSIKETEALGIEKTTVLAQELGDRVRQILEARGFKSVAQDAYKSPTVVVCHSDKPDMVARFKSQLIQVAGGVPFKLDEPAGLQTFRVGLFGLDKLADVEKTVAVFEEALDKAVQDDGGKEGKL